jgi:glucose/mannose-6-phosphate isomerase
MDQATLDDPARIAAVDRSGMLQAIAALGGQLGDGFELGRRGPIPSAWAEQALQGGVVVCGMGGSGIAGDVVGAVLADRVPGPIMVSKGFGLPGFCGPRTLVVAVSYSGNTEETLAAYHVAGERGCRTVTVSAGGHLAKLADARGSPHVELPPDAPMPRAALGYVAGAVLGVVGLAGGPDISAEVAAAAGRVDELAARWHPGRSTEVNEAKSLADWLAGRTPVIWGSEGLMEPAALRWKNQMNENAKLPAFWSVLPELDHNEVEGWSGDTAKEFAVVALRYPGEHPHVAQRFALTMEIASSAGLDVREVRAESGGPMTWLFEHILLGDFVSTYLAILRGVDPTPVPVLAGLKARLRR